MSGETLTPLIVLTDDGKGSSFKSLSVAGGESSDKSSYCPALLAKAQNNKLCLIAPVLEADGCVAAIATSLNSLASTKLNPGQNQFSKKVCLPNPEDLNASDVTSCSIFSLAKKALPPADAATLTVSSNVIIARTLDDKLFGSRRGVAFVAGIALPGTPAAKPMQTSPINTGFTLVAGHKVATLQFSVELENPKANVGRVARLAVAQMDGQLGEMGTDLTEFLQVLGLSATGAPTPLPATPAIGTKRPRAPPSTTHQSANRATARRLLDSDDDADSVRTDGRDTSLPPNGFNPTAGPAAPPAAAGGATGAQRRQVRIA